MQAPQPPASDRQDNMPEQSQQSIEPIPFKDFLSIVAFAAAITISVSVSASQAFATAGNLFGISLSDVNDSNAVLALGQTKRGAVFLSWAAALSGLSLMLTLLLQLLMTSPAVYEPLIDSGGCLRYVFGAASFLAIGLQGAALGMIGEALKGISHSSGTMIQWCLLGTGLPAALLWWFLLKMQRNNVRSSTLPS